MAVSNIKASFPCSVEKLWNLVTSFEDCSWRSDLSKIDTVSPTRFIEYTKDGYGTTFTITAMEPFRLWEFDMENSNMAGHWTGIFSEENGTAFIDFTEDVSPKKFFLKPFVKAYLKKQQSAYISDLRNVLSR